MTQIVNSVGAFGGDPGRGGHQHEAEQHPPAPPADQPAEPAVSVEENPDIRLVIESDDAAGEFVYRTVDRRTGETIRELRRDGVLKLSEASDYSAGSLIRTQA